MAEHRLHILKSGPFLKSQSPTAINLALLMLLLPSLFCSCFVVNPSYGVGYGLFVLGGGLAGSLLWGPNRRGSLASLDWAATSALAALIPLPSPPELVLAAPILTGFFCGALCARPQASFLLGSPGLIALVASFLTFLLLTLPMALAEPILWPCGLTSWPQALALATAGVCWVARARAPRYWLAPWLAGLVGWVFLHFFHGGLANNGDFYPPPSWLAGLMVAIFFIRPNLWRPTNPKAQDQPEPTQGLPALKCGHQGLAPRLGQWQGPSSCRLAAAHDDGPLICPFGCLGLGDCLRACPFEAITVNELGFPQINAKLCQSCGHCAQACPKGLIEMETIAGRVRIPCASQSGLKTSATYCLKACLGCGRCRKACPANAIQRLGGNGAMNVDHGLCLAYGASCDLACVLACPRQIIKKIP